MALSPITRTPEQLDAILRSGSGTLLDTPYPVLLLALALREKSAVLSLHRNQLQKEIVFDDGAPVDCQSNIATETFGRFLVSSGKLSEQNCRTALALASSRGVPFEEILTEEKLLPPTDLDRMLQQSLGRKLLDPFSWKSGTFEIFFDAPPVESALRVKVPQLVLTGILKVETQEAVDEAIAFASDRYLAVSTEPLFDLDDIRLSSDQQKVLDAARQGMRLADVAAQSGVESDDVSRIVYALLLLGALTVVETPVRAAPLFELDHPFLENASAPSPLPASSRRAEAQVEGPTPAIEPATAEEVIAAYLSHRRKDAFDLLGVTDTDGPLRFIRAFLQMSDKFLPSKFDERAPDGLREKAQEVFLAAARAYAELADPTRREALLLSRSIKRKEPALDETAPVVPAPAVESAAPAPVEKIAEKTTEKPAEKPPVQKPAARPLERPPLKRALIDPEALCKTGRELAEAGKLREALSSFEMAAECDAQNGTYAAEVAWCRFRLQVSPAPNTLRMLKNAIRIDPRCGLAHLYAGRVAAAIGNRTEASAFLDRAAMLMPRDMRIVEALKALR
jgi:tetratricopeptide (TPR) repeat protein